MGLRFQKRMQVFPGVRLNFSRSGVSATIGVRGASVTLGRDGAHANLGLPGSGLSYRKKVMGWGKADAPDVASDVPAGDSQETVRGAAPDSEEADRVWQEDVFDGLDPIESAPLEDVASAGLEELHDLIEDAGRHRQSLKTALGEARHALRRAEWELARASVWYRRWISRGKIPALHDAIKVYKAEVEDLYAALDACVIDLDLSLPPTILDAFIRLAKAFDDLQGSEVIWDVTAARDDGRWDGADMDRKEVDFFFADSALMKCKMRAMLFGNANGADMHIYPAFVLLRDRGDGFALIDPRDLLISYEAVSFVEDGPLPDDAQVIGEGWEHVNAKGTRDRRRKGGNRMLAKVLYGSLTVYSRDGVNERWLISNAAAAERFSRAWIAYQKALPPLEAMPLGGSSFTGNGKDGFGGF